MNTDKINNGSGTQEAEKRMPAAKKRCRKQKMLAAFFFYNTN